MKGAKLFLAFQATGRKSPVSRPPWPHVPAGIPGQARQDLTDEGITFRRTGQSLATYTRGKRPDILESRGCQAGRATRAVALAGSVPMAWAEKPKTDERASKEE